MGSPSALPLGFGMLGGLVPVSLPFQFPPLLNFNPPGTPGATGMGSGPSSNSGYSLAQSDLMGEWMVCTYTFCVLLSAPATCLCNR